MFIFRNKKNWCATKPIYFKESALTTHLIVYTFSVEIVVTFYSRLLSKTTGLDKISWKRASVENERALYKVKRVSYACLMARRNGTFDVIQSSCLRSEFYARFPYILPLPVHPCSPPSPPSHPFFSIYTREWMLREWIVRLRERNFLTTSNVHRFLRAIEWERNKSKKKRKEKEEKEEEEKKRR